MSSTTQTPSKNIHIVNTIDIHLKERESIATLTADDRISSMLCYYGLAYSSSNLAGDIFLNFILVSLAEVPAFLIGMFVVEWTGRRPIANVCLMGAGIFCLAAGLVPQGLERYSSSEYKSQTGFSDRRSLIDSSSQQMIGKLWT